MNTGSRIQTLLTISGLVWLPTIGVGKLVLKSKDEIFLENDVDYNRLKNEAILVKSVREEAEGCPDAEMTWETFEIWVETPDGLRREHIETGSYVDIIENKTRIHNALEPWIYMDIIIRPLMNCLEADHPMLLKHLHKYILHPPSSNLQYNWTTKEPSLTGQFGQPQFLDSVIFKGQVKDGFFIEAGADDFESDSNTAYFELRHNWTGILVEPNPTIFPVGLTKQRKSWGAGTCLGLSDRSSVQFFASKAVELGMAGLVPEETEESFRMQCFPLYSLILATGNRTVNYLSLDIEGAELQVLKSIPWDKVDIEVLTVESNHMGEVFPGSQEDLRNFMKEQGYVLAYTVHIDDVFVRKDLYEGKYKPDLNMAKKFEETFGKTCGASGNNKVEFYKIVTHILHNRRKSKT